MKLLSYLSCLCAVGAFTLSVVAWALNPRHWANRQSAFAAFVYSLWAWGMVFAYGSENPAWAEAGYQFSFLGSLFLAPSLLGLFLGLAQVSRRIRSWLLVASWAYSLVMLIVYHSNGFYYASFRDGPWGNIGIPSDQWFWATVNPYVLGGEILAGVLIWRARARRQGTERERRQLRILVPAVAGTLVLYFLAWVIEVTWAAPNAMVVAGALLVGASFVIVARYRYLRPDRALLEKQSFQGSQDSVIVLDTGRRVVGINEPALRRFNLTASDLVGCDLGTLLQDSLLLDREWHLVTRRQSLHRGLLCTLAGQTVVLTLSPRFDEFDDLVGVVALLGDLPGFEDRVAALGLTARETQVLLLAFQGANAAEIADALSISPTTVKTHIHSMCEKTGSAHRVELLGRLVAGHSSYSTFNERR